MNFDGRRGTADDVYVGNAASQNGGDPFRWRWGVRDGGRWIVGGYGDKGYWVLNRMRQLLRR